MARDSDFRLVYCLFLLSCLLYIGCEFSLASTPENGSEKVEEFIPTDDWQIVKDGQAIPPGLYVRMNLETGQKMARLLHDDEKVGRQIAPQQQSHGAVSTVATQDSEESVQLDEKSSEHNERNEAAMHMFSKLHAAQDDPAGNGVAPTFRESSGAANSEGESNILDLNNVFDLMSASSSHSSQQQLPSPAALRYSDPQVVEDSRERMRELSSLLKPTDDVDTMRSLLSFVVSPDASYDDVLLALDSLELLVHQVDNANDWVKIGGMNIVKALIEPVEDALEDEDESLIPADQSAVDRRVKTHRLLNLQSSACRVLGSAAQNNPEVGAAALDTGLVRGLLQVLNQSSADIARDYRKLVAAAQTSSEASLHSSLSKEEAVISSDITLHQLRLARFQLQSRAFYALSALIRHSQSAQLTFLQHSGHVLLKHFLLPEFSTVHLLRAIPICSSPTLTPAAVPLCISEQQLKDELEMQAAVNFKAAAMVYDLVSDGIINSKISEKSSALPLFEALTDSTVCSLLPSFALQVVNVSFSLPASLPSPFSVSLLLEPNFTSLSTREQILRLLVLFLENGQCSSMWTENGVSESIEDISWQQRWLWETQKDIEKADKIKQKRMQTGDVNAAHQISVEDEIEKLTAADYSLSSYYEELHNMANAILKFVHQQ